MNHRLSFSSIGHASSLFLAFSFTICFIFDWLFADAAMYTAWSSLLPGFDGINLKSFVIGLVESYAYGWYFVLVWVPLYNYFISRNELNQ
ncbi:hypothetical protein MNBD_GAMMA12-1741 [hydrothermal vent metagenome]|uniref:Uncharacterized protein n=1 Tax=hydrothermal vent metagenome TaxID=652676 RepID=A0A3B0XXU3_9ZZZZ